MQDSSSSLKNIVESFENKLLNEYRFDKFAFKRGENCENCFYFNNNYCNFLNDKVDKRYTCNNFKVKEDEKKEK